MSARFAVCLYLWLGVWGWLEISLWLPLCVGGAASPKLNPVPSYNLNTRTPTHPRTHAEANKIIKIALPSGSRLPDHWVKRGVALLALGRLDDFEDRDGDAGPSRNGGRGSS